MDIQKPRHPAWSPLDLSLDFVTVRRALTKYRGLRVQFFYFARSKSQRFIKCDQQNHYIEQREYKESKTGEILIPLIKTSKEPIAAVV